MADTEIDGVIKAIWNSLPAENRNLKTLEEDIAQRVQQSILAIDFESSQSRSSTSGPTCPWIDCIKNEFLRIRFEDETIDFDAVWQQATEECAEMGQNLMQSVSELERSRWLEILEMLKEAHKKAWFERN